MLKQTLMVTLFFTWSEASVITLTDILQNAKEPKLLSRTIKEEQQALGGKVKTYEVVPNLNAMRTLSITLDDIFKTLKANNQNGGAG